MGIADQPASQTTHGATSGRALLLATFTAAITLSAALLFMVQPMFTKMVLPRFGGAPSVWSVAIVYFQTALLAGYAYAHVLTRYTGPRASVVIHLAVMIAAAFALPLSIPTGWDRPPAAAEARRRNNAWRAIIVMGRRFRRPDGLRQAHARTPRAAQPWTAIDAPAISPTNATR